jgi:hypothetical protein
VEEISADIICVKKYDKREEQKGKCDNKKEKMR